MTIPDYQAIMLPLLQLARDGKDHTSAEAIEVLTEQFHLSKADLEEMLPSGTRLLFQDRVSWAKTYLKQAGLLTYPKRGTFRITDRGLQLLQSDPSSLDNTVLEQFPEFQDFISRRHAPRAARQASTSETLDKWTPRETLEDMYAQINATLAGDLLDRIKRASPAFFEQLVVQLLVAMGYGGSFADTAQVIGRSGDEGIDGIIKQDPLGLDSIYVQAKRWSNSVQRPEIQKFVGALHGHKARKGVFITTATFSSGAMEYASNLDTKVVLIDGDRLAELMILHNIGVKETNTFVLKKIDTDYFEEE